jgi:hypothetical protein
LRGDVVVLAWCAADAAGFGSVLCLVVWGSGVAEYAVDLACQVPVERLEA